MGGALVKMDTEMPREIVVLYGACPMGLPVHGSSYPSGTGIDDDGTTIPAPYTSKDFLHDRGILFGKGLHIGMVGACSPLYPERQSRLEINHSGIPHPWKELPDFFPWDELPILFPDILFQIVQLLPQKFLQSCPGEQMPDGLVAV